MDAMIYFAGILLVTISAGVMAVVLDWLMLWAAFRWMQPAGARRTAAVRAMAAPARPLRAHR